MVRPSVLSGFHKAALAKSWAKVLLTFCIAGKCIFTALPNVKGMEVKFKYI